MWSGNSQRVEGKRVDMLQLERDMIAWRQDFHAHPEFGFEEKRTAAIVAAKLREFGLEVAEGVGGTGVVGTLKRGTSNRAIALRADMDALRIQEQGKQAYVSTKPGTMHACGHDGHTAMLLGAAAMLASDGSFDGTVRFIFQPAEEWGRGALAMIADGLMERFPYEEIYGIHNMPGMAVGTFQTKAGAIMSAEDNFEIVLKGVGGHAARPHSANEVMVAACATVMNLQSIVSRRLSPAEIAVVSVTELLTDGTRNALPGLARILGDARSFNPIVSAEIEKQMRKIADATASAYDISAEVHYTREFIPLVNDADLVSHALIAARTVYEPTATSLASEPVTASEDFAQFLKHVPGCFMFIGNGLDSAPLHNPNYDFADAALMQGARLQAEIVRRRLTLA